MMNLKIYTTFLILSFVCGGLLCTVLPQKSAFFSLPEMQVMLLSTLLTLFIMKSFAGISSSIPAILGAWAAVSYERFDSLASYPFVDVGITLFVTPILSMLIILFIGKEMSHFLRLSSSHLLLKAWYLRIILIIGLVISGMLMIYNYSLIIVPFFANFWDSYDKLYIPLVIFIFFALIINIFNIDHHSLLRSNKMSDFIELIYGLSIVLVLFNIIFPLLGLSNKPIIVPITLAAMAGTVGLNLEKSYNRIIHIAIGMFVVPTVSFLIGTILFHLYDSIIVLTSSIFIFIMLVVLAKLFARQFQQHKLIKSALQDEQQRRSEIHKELNRLDMNSVTSQFDILSNKMEMKKQELLNLALHIKQQHDYIEMYSKKLKDISDSDDINAIKSELRSIIAEMQENMKFTKEMDLFYTEVDELHKGFISKLMTVCLSLTEQEKRLAIFLRLGFSSKEIASLLNISAKSVEISRYRFRKKLKMERDENLVHYIQSL
jgi:DNA-binding CsgD family transcriptional regulator